MKKTALVLLSLLTLIFPLFSLTNSQKIYSVDDPVYGYIRDLYLLEGLSTPSTTGPWSGSELERMLEILDRASLSEVSAGLYDRAFEIIKADSSEPVFSLGLDIHEELFIHTNPAEQRFWGRENWWRGWENENQFLSIVTEGRFGSSLYGIFNLSFGVARDWRKSSGENPTYRTFADRAVWSNTPFVGPNDIDQFNMNFPYRTFVAAGTDYWSLQFGRDRLSWGNGTTGNFVIDSHLKFHNMIRFSAFGGTFKYTFLVSSFPHPMNYYYDDGSGNMVYDVLGLKRDDGSYYGQSQIIKGTKAFIGHRLEWRIVPSLSFYLTEAVMYMSAEGRVDLVDFMPSFLYHNLYNRSNANSILSLEADWSFANGWNIYGQFVLDDLYLSGESPTDDGNIEPNALGYLAGITYATGLGKGVLKFNLEGALTQPYLYLRDGDEQDYELNYVVALREMSGAAATQNYNLEYLGYKYGGDAIVGNLNASYCIPGSWSLGANLFCMLHGGMDKTSPWSRVPADKKQIPPTDPSTTTIVAGLCADCPLSYGFSFGVQADCVIMRNPDISDCQITLCISYAI